MNDRKEWRLPESAWVRVWVVTSIENEQNAYPPPPGTREEEESGVAVCWTQNFSFVFILRLIFDFVYMCVTCVCTYVCRYL